MALPKSALNRTCKCQGQIEDMQNGLPTSLLSTELTRVKVRSMQCRIAFPQVCFQPNLQESRSDRGEEELPSSSRLSTELASVKVRSRKCRMAFPRVSSQPNLQEVISVPFSPLSIERPYVLDMLQSIDRFDTAASLDSQMCSFCFPSIRNRYQGCYICLT